MSADAYAEGMLAAKRGQSVIDNPHTGLSLASGNSWKLWRDGFAASAIETRSAIDAKRRGPKGESATRKGDAQ